MLGVKIGTSTLQPPELNDVLASITATLRLAYGGMQAPERHAEQHRSELTVDTEPRWLE
jgi:hypothetical protein